MTVQTDEARDWLAPLVRRLDKAGRPVAVFFRNDDVGWADDDIVPLLDLFAARALPLDLSVIPAALTDATAQMLADRCTASEGRLRAHQHGWRHANHEAAGRKCEFGAARAPDEQAADLKAGQERLRAMLGPFVDPIFTPPWNRCTQATADVLAAGPYRVLSRDVGAAPLDTRAVTELPVAVDWDKALGMADGVAALGRAVADAVGGGCPTGIMLHHAVMDAESRDALGALLDLLAGHENARCLSMMDCAGLDRR